MILGQGLIFLFKVLSFDYQMTYCFQWMRTLLLSMWTPIYLHQVHFPEFNRWSKKVKVHAYLNRISTLLICNSNSKLSVIICAPCPQLHDISKLTKLLYLLNSWTNIIRNLFTHINETGGKNFEIKSWFVYIVRTDTTAPSMNQSLHFWMTFLENIPKGTP